MEHRRVRCSREERPAGALPARRAPAISLERDLGLGSLERVELLSRLEGAFGRPLDDRCLRARHAARARRALVADRRRRQRCRCWRRPARVRRHRSQAWAPRPRWPAAPPSTSRCGARAEATPDRPHVYLREDDGREKTITYGRSAEPRPRVGGRPARARRAPRRHRGAHAAHRPRLPRAPSRASCWRAPCPCPSTRRRGSTAWRSTRERQSAILADAEVRRSSPSARARAGGRGAALARSPTPAPRGHRRASWPSTARSLVGDAEGAGRPRVHPVHLRQHRRAQGRAAHPRQPARQHPRHRRGARGAARPTSASSWLPLYHDMGLIGSWLFCMHRGLPIAIQSPLVVPGPARALAVGDPPAARPRSRRRPTSPTSCACARSPTRRSKGSTSRPGACALNGAEPVSPETLERFAARFAPYGFRREAMMPVYGLAENSVALCFPPPGPRRRASTASRARRSSARAARCRPRTTTPRALRFVVRGRAAARARGAHRGRRGRRRRRAHASAGSCSAARR